MKRVLAGALAVAAIVVAGTVQAAEICQWTGTDWACGDGNVFTRHHSLSAGPNMVITPAPAVIPPSQAVPTYYLPRSY